MTVGAALEAADAAGLDAFDALLLEALGVDAGDVAVADAGALAEALALLAVALDLLVVDADADAVAVAEGAVA